MHFARNCTGRKTKSALNAGLSFQDTAFNADFASLDFEPFLTKPPLTYFSTVKMHFSWTTHPSREIDLQNRDVAFSGKEIASSRRLRRTTPLWGTRFLMHFVSDGPKK